MVCSSYQWFQLRHPFRIPPTTIHLSPKSSFIFQLLLLSTLCAAQRTPSGTLTNQQFLQVCFFENCKNDIKQLLITYLCQGFRSARRSTEFRTTTTTAELHTTTELYSATATELYYTTTTRFSPTAAPTTRPDPTATAAACRSYSTTTTEPTTCTIPTTAA